MARRSIPDLGRIDRKMSKRKLLKIMHEQLYIARGDEDKASSIDDSCYYEGWGDALEWVEKLMTKQKDMKRGRGYTFHFVVGVHDIPVGFAYVPEWDQVFEPCSREYSYDNVLLYWAFVRAMRKGIVNKRGNWGVEVTRWGIFWKSKVEYMD